MSEELSIVYTSDLHGDTSLYEELYRLVSETASDVLILGGDLLPRDGVFNGWIEPQRDFIFGYLNHTLATVRRENPGLRVYLMMGNVDWAANMEALEAGAEHGLYALLHLNCHELAPNWWIAGYSCVPPTPFVINDWDRRDLAVRAENIGRPYRGSTPPQNSIEEDLMILGGLSDPALTIYVMHSPPYQTNLDQLYDRRPIGSRAIRRFIEDRQPPLTLHGHVHESPSISGRYWDRLGRTICVNPGQGRWPSGGTRLQAVTFTLPSIWETLRHTTLGQPASP